MKKIMCLVVTGYVKCVKDGVVKTIVYFKYIKKINLIFSLKSVKFGERIGVDKAHE